MSRLHRPHSLPIKWEISGNHLRASCRDTRSGQLHEMDYELQDQYAPQMVWLLVSMMTDGFIRLLGTDLSVQPVGLMAGVKC